MNVISLDSAVPRCDASRRRELIRDFFLQRKPVVVAGLADDWPARWKWRPEFFLEHYPHVRRKIGDRVWTIAEYLGLMNDSSPQHPAPYPFNFDLLATFPQLIEDVQPQPLFGKLDRATHWAMRRSLYSGTKVHELFFGGDGSFFPVLHCDLFYLHGYVTQIFGSKEFYLYSPDQTGYVYPSPGNPKISSVDDPLRPDLERFPLFAKARAIRVIVQPGETIFIPFGWWHCTRLIGPNIAYGGIGLNASNWPNFIDDIARSRAGSWKAGAIRAYGKIAGAAMSAHEALLP